MEEKKMEQHRPPAGSPAIFLSRIFLSPFAPRSTNQDQRPMVKGSIPERVLSAS
jgi:hypothetical protein